MTDPYTEIGQMQRNDKMATSLDVVQRLIFCLAAALLLSLQSCQLGMVHRPEEKPFYRAINIFEPGEYGLRCHSSTITELANGDLLAAWWSGSYEGATDAVIKTARFPFGARSWESAVTLVDIPDRFVGNPVLFSLPNGCVWLFFVTVDPSSRRMVQIMFLESNDLCYTWSPIKKFITEPGIRTRNHLIIMQSGEILFPLFNQIKGQALFLISGDLGKKWEVSEPIISDPPNVQPTVISKKNGDLYALMRTWHDEPKKRFLWQSKSQDYGRTWSSPSYSQIPTVSSAIEMIKLKNGNVVLAFNNGRDRERTPLNLALSLDEGCTWPYNRILESGQGSFSYPSLIQSQDGHIHVTYTYRRELIKHVEVNEAWIKAVSFTDYK